MSRLDKESAKDLNHIKIVSSVVRADAYAPVATRTSTREPAKKRVAETGFKAVERKYVQKHLEVKDGIKTVNAIGEVEPGVLPR